MIEVLAPDGTGLGVKSGGVAARLDIQASVSGTYSVVVSDANRSGTGTYRLRLAQVPTSFTVPAGDEGGPLANGANQQGTIDLGDLDLWTVTATRGDRITVQIGEVSGGAGFTPMIELFAPDGTRLGVNSGGVVARLDVQANTSGTYTLLVSDA
ncbi:MAG: peptidase, partial [Verrucomicrobia bacterium]